MSEATPTTREGFSVSKPPIFQLTAPSRQATSDCLVGTESTANDTVGSGGDGNSTTADCATTEDREVAVAASRNEPSSIPIPTPPVLPEVPQQLLDGVPMIKVTANKIKPREFKLTQTGSAITWESRKLGVAEVCQIREIRLGAALPDYIANRSISTADAARWISIVYVQPPSQWKILHMVALSDESYELWVSTLRTLLNEIKIIAGAAPATGSSLMTVTGDKAARDGQDRAIHWARRFWTSGGPAAADSAMCTRVTTKQLGFDAVLNLCKKAGIGCTQHEVRQIFERVDHGNKGALTFPEFQTFVQSLKSRPDVDELYQLLAPNGSMDLHCFTNFLTAYQGIAPDDARIAKWFNKSCKSSPGADVLTAGDFAAFLTSPDNSIVMEEDQKVGQDMSRPLHDYFISSSHNTYLVGGQWRGESTVEGYVRALLAGCRTVEIDCWDGDHEPVVYHGNTLTSSVSVRQVCRAIAKYGFLASPYPIIISAEVHCCLEQQDLLARILRVELGETLVVSELHEASGVLPTPHQLRGKILFKTKQTEQRMDTITRTSTTPFFDYASLSESTESDADLMAVRSQSPSLVGRLSRRLSTTKRAVATRMKPAGDASSPPITPHSAPLGTSPSIGDPLQQQQRPAHRRASSSSISKPQSSTDLMALLIYTSGTKFRGFSKIAPYGFNEMFSLGEKTATKLIKTASEDLVKHNRSHLTRVYPKGTRVTSSNYEPILFWRVGCQLVAINWQTTDAGFKLNFAMFSRNGRCGYVLKPEYLRVKPKETSELPHRYRLTVEIISGQQLPTCVGGENSEDVPWVNTTLYLPPPLSNALEEAAAPPPSPSRPQMQVFRTRKIKGNTFNPRWSERTSFTFTSLPSMLDLSFLDLELRNDEDDTERGRWCGSLSGLRPGYRHVPLYDHLYSQYLYSTLFIYTKLDII